MTKKIIVTHRWAIAPGRNTLIYDLITSSLNSREKYSLVFKQKRLSIVTTTHSCDDLKELSYATSDAMLRDNYHGLKCDTLVWKKYPIEAVLFTLWIGFYPSCMFESCKTETVNRNRRLYPPSWSWPLGVRSIKQAFHGRSQDFSNSTQVRSWAQIKYSQRFF